MGGALKAERLIEAARGGDENAFRALAEPWTGELRAHCTRILGDPHDAEDAVQETLVKAWRGLAGFRGGGSLRSWLYSIATNTCLNLKRGGVRRPATPVAELPEPAASRGDDAYERQEQLELLFVAVLQRLPARQRAVLLLREALGWSPGEIAELLGVSRPAVNSALQRARATLASEGDVRRLDDVHLVLLSRYVAAWDATDVEGIVALTRRDATRTTLIEQLEPVGGGWVHVPEGAPTHDRLAFRPMFSRR